MRSIELKELPPELVELLLYHPGEPISLMLDGKECLILMSEAVKDEPPIDVNASPRLQAILEASHKSYEQQGGVPLEEVRQLIQQWETEETSASLPATRS